MTACYSAFLRVGIAEHNMNTNIREETEWKKSCQWCKWFTSYQDEYEDELEPPDFGRCNNEANSDKDECFGDGLTCDLFERAGNAL